MKRSSYKYLFLFNTVFIAAIIAVMLFAEKNSDDNDEIRANITTPLLSAKTIDVSLCENAHAAVLIDAKSGAVLFEKNASKRLPMASTTKIMTALVAIENSNPDDVVTVSQNAANTTGSSIYLEAGEKITVRDLLYGLMLESGNDAATALAEGVFGSVENCCKAMNEKACEIGLKDTEFSNPHGLDEQNHYTTAYELALITKKAMNNGIFKELVSTKSYVSEGEKVRYFSNHNRLLKTSSRAIGVKTGYTSKSGRCLVSAVSESGEEYIAVTLNDSLDWQDHKRMHDYAFNNFESYEIADVDSFYVYSGLQKFTVSDSIYITTSGEKSFVLNYRISFDNDKGEAEYFAGNTRLGRFFLQKSTL